MIDQELISRFAGKRFLLILGHYANIGGAERQAIILADQLKTRVGCQVDFLAWGGVGAVTEELNKRDIKTWTFNLNWGICSPIQRSFKLYQLANFIKHEIRPDYLLPFIGFNCKIIGLIWKFSGAKYTWWNQRDEGREIHGSRIERYVLKSVPDVVSNSYEGRDFLVKTFNFLPDQIHVFNNGVLIPEPGDRLLWRDKLGITADDVLITMIANLTKYKDHETLLEAFATLRLCDAGKRCHLMLVGRPRETEQRLKMLAFELGLCGYVHFVGETKNVSEYYAATDLAVHSSYKEGCPNAVLEAMAHGLPVCGTDISGIRQALGIVGPSELLAPPGDFDSLSRIMQKLVENGEVRKSLGQRNLQRIKDHFSPEQLTGNVLALIHGHLS